MPEYICTTGCYHNSRRFKPGMRVFLIGDVPHHFTLFEDYLKQNKEENEAMARPDATTLELQAMVKELQAKNEELTKALDKPAPAKKPAARKPAPKK